MSSEQERRTQDRAEVGWISVKERLPEYDTDVILWGTGWDQVYLGYWRHSNEWIGRQRPESVGGLPRTNPTRWCPLPAPPPDAPEKETPEPGEPWNTNL